MKTEFIVSKNLWAVSPRKNKHYPHTLSESYDFVEEQRILMEMRELQEKMYKKQDELLKLCAGHGRERWGEQVKLLSRDGSVSAEWSSLGDLLC